MAGLGVLIALLVFGDEIVDRNCSRGPDHTLDRFSSDRDADRLIGLTREEVIADLGEPTSTRFAPEWDMNYWLRPQGFCMDGWYLVLNLSDGRVVQAKVLGD